MITLRTAVSALLECPSYLGFKSIECVLGEPLTLISEKLNLLTFVRSNHIPPDPVTDVPLPEFPDPVTDSQKQFGT